MSLVPHQTPWFHKLPREHFLPSVLLSWEDMEGLRQGTKRRKAIISKKTQVSPGPASNSFASCLPRPVRVEVVEAEGTLHNKLTDRSFFSALFLQASSRCSPTLFHGNHRRAQRNNTSILLIYFIS